MPKKIIEQYLGRDDCKIEQLLHFLHHTRSKYLYIVGDFVDCWQMYIHHGWSQNCNECLRCIFRKVKKGTTIRMSPGNHDRLIHIMNGFVLGNIEVRDQFMHMSPNYNHKYLVIHGDKYDNLVTKYEFISRNINIIYEFISRNIAHAMLPLPDRLPAWGSSRALVRAAQGQLQVVRKLLNRQDLVLRQ